MISFGWYYYHLKAWFDAFPRDQFFVMTTKQLNDRHTLEGLLDFIGVDQSAIDSMQLDVRPRGHSGDPISAAARAELLAFYAPYNQRLFDLLGVDDLPW